MFYKGVTKIDWSLILIILIGISIFFNARKTRSLIFVQSIALLFGMVIINLILFIILFGLAIILADSFNALRIGSIFTLSMWVIVLSGLIHYLIFRKFQEKFNLPTTVLTMVEYYIQWILIYMTIYQVMFDTLHKVVKEIPDILNLDLSYLINPTYLIIAIFPALIATWITIVLYKVYKKDI
ncbi:SA1002 family membrane protein [Ligilactobacillus salivarius]